MRKFSERGIKNQYSRAVQIWQILVSKAHNRQTVTNRMLGDLLGYRNNKVGILHRYIDVIDSYCVRNRLPILTCLIVVHETGKPISQEAANNVDAHRERVFACKYWYDIYTREEDFREAYEELLRGI